jgi:hypothetical protein
MARSDARNVKPSMSADPADKLAAALKGAAEGIAASLPAAPRCPL